MTQIKNRSNWKVVQVVQNKRIWDVPEVDDVENEDLNILESLSAIEWMSTSRMTLYPGLTLIPQSLKDRLCVMSLTTSSTMWMNTCIISFPRTNFLETDAMFLEFADDLDNLVGGSLFVDDNLGEFNNGRKYIEVIKGDLQQSFVIDFSDQAMNRFVEHQMLTIFKEYRDDCHKHFKKYNDAKKVRANPTNLLVGRDKD
ncbi:gamma-aminobutyrate transaminase POP2 [Cucumis melo var. makuwa]|uniref:Gamma-aminobutyrate transaminase POP2 n=1 Tax=Cucumis melo var. makuwa TaxID=1194695 RepID=A0A5D3DQF1_CUCMM|nr:gamma-aminobutyrate transaminase POP2 [Cucumis melo var. makuwa]